MSGLDVQLPDKRFATLRARAAIAGATLHRGEDDRGTEVFVLSKWSLTREMTSLEQVEAWLDRLAGK